MSTMTKTSRIHVASIGQTIAFDTSTSSHNERTSHLGDDVMSLGERKTSAILINALKPLFLSMMCAGIFDYKYILKDVIRENVRGKCLKAYRLTIIFLLAANFLRYCMSYSAISDFGAEFLSNIMLHMWFLHCCVNVLVCYTVVENPNKLGYFFILWDKYWKNVNNAFGNNTGDLVNASICKTVRNATPRLTAFAWIFVIGNASFGSYICVKTNMFPHFLTPLSLSHPQAQIAIAVFLVIQVYLTLVWCLTGIAMFLIHL